MSKRDIALDLYNMFKGQKRTFIKTSEAESQNSLSNRSDGEPKPVGDLIKELISERDWKGGLAEGELFAKWSEVVGTEIASKSEPIEVRDGKLFIKCVSTAWMTQLNLIKKELLETIQKIAPAITALEIYGPNAPSWRKGLRTVQGAKGPRDTYG